MLRNVFHIRLQNFEVQVERLIDGSLATRPIAVISSHTQNGTIVALSPEAEREGLFHGMPVSLARKMSHSVRLLPYNTSLYSRMNDYLYGELQQFSPVIEPATFGQFFIDMSGMHHLCRDLPLAGSRMNRTLRRQYDLRSRIGISENKLVSSISTAVVPEDIYTVDQGTEPHFLSPMASSVLPVSEENSIRKIITFLFLNQVNNIQNITSDPDITRTLFREHAVRITKESRGQDQSAVQPPQLRNHIIRQTVLRADTNDTDLLTAAVTSLAEELAFELRRRNQTADSTKLEIHYTDGFKNARTARILYNDNNHVRKICLDLFDKANYRRNRVRSLILDASRFRTATHQMNLFEKPVNDTLSLTVDAIRNRFGFCAVRAASQLLVPDIRNSVSNLAKV